MIRDLNELLNTNKITFFIYLLPASFHKHSIQHAFIKRNIKKGKSEHLLSDWTSKYEIYNHKFMLKKYVIQINEQIHLILCNAKFINES